MSKSYRSTSSDESPKPVRSVYRRSGSGVSDSRVPDFLDDTLDLSKVVTLDGRGVSRRDVETKRLRSVLAQREAEISDLDMKNRALERENESLWAENKGLVVEKKRLLSQIKGQQDEVKAVEKEVEFERSLRVVVEYKLALKEAEVAHERLAGERAASKEQVWRGKGM